LPRKKLYEKSRLVTMTAEQSQAWSHDAEEADLDLTSWMRQACTEQHALQEAERRQREAARRERDELIRLTSGVTRELQEDAAHRRLARRFGEEKGWL
jgi:hypothetical protein